MMTEIIEIAKPFVIILVIVGLCRIIFWLLGD